jgi:hypothetical protein
MLPKRGTSIDQLKCNYCDKLYKACKCDQDELKNNIVAKRMNRYGTDKKRDRSSDVVIDRTKKKQEG